MRTPLVDDVLLVHLHPRSGRAPLDPEATTNLLVAALMLELVAGERLTRGRGGGTGGGPDPLEVVDDRPTGDPELDGALAELSAKRMTTANVLSVRRRGLRARIGERLLLAGRVRSGTGLLAGRRLVPSGSPDEAALRAALAEAAVTGVSTSTRAMQVLYVSGTQGLAHRAAGVRRRDVRPEALRLGGPEWLRLAMTSRPSESGHPGPT